MNAGFSVGIMQPYFFPYWGHFALIAATDQWVVFDVTQYTPKTWMNRNRVLHPTQGWQYVSVPLQGASMAIRTSEARLVDRQACGEQIVRQLMHYKKRAPFYAATIELVRAAFAQPSDDSLVSLNVASLQHTCDYLGIAFKPQVCSRMGLDLPDQLGAGDWAPTIASQMKATRYVNPAGGRELFDPARFEADGIELAFLETDEFVYPVPGRPFEPNLSILDVMMWNSPEHIREVLSAQARVVPVARTPV